MSIYCTYIIFSLVIFSYVRISFSRMAVNWGEFLELGEVERNQEQLVGSKVVEKASNVS